VLSYRFPITGSSHDVCKAADQRRLSHEADAWDLNGTERWLARTLKRLAAVA
jgi:hypothetical protein